MTEPTELGEGGTRRGRERAGLRTGPCVVLLVEDHDDTRRLLGVVLGRAGHSVTAVATLAEARQALRSCRRPFDVMVADLDLPDGYGDVLIGEFKAAFPAGTVIVASGHAYPADVDRARGKGADAYLVKPFTLHDLERAVAQTADCPPAADEMAK